MGSLAGADHQTSRLHNALAVAEVEVEDLRHGARVAADEIAGFLALKTFPRGRRPETEKQVSRLRGAARGEVETAYAAVPNQRLRRAMRIGEAETVYSVDRWLKECESRGHGAAHVTSMIKPDDAYRLHVREIAAIRAALAYEAGGLAATLEYATFPKSPRPAATNLVGRMRQAARGDVESSFPTIPAADLSTSAPGAVQAIERCAIEVAQLRSVALSCSLSLDSYLLFKSFPKSRRQITLSQIARLQAAASGAAEVAYAGLPSYALTAALHDAGATNASKTGSAALTENEIENA